MSSLGYDIPPYLEKKYKSFDSTSESWRKDYVRQNETNCDNNKNQTLDNNKNQTLDRFGLEKLTYTHA